MATEEFTGSNFYSPFVQSLPRIEWSGDGWLKTKAGQLILTNQPDEADHPFGYSTNWNSFITNPNQQFPTAIHPGEPEGPKAALWYGYAVIRNISDDGLTFDLYENAKATALGNKRLVGDYSVATNPMWSIDADCAFPSATQNEILEEDAKNLMRGGVMLVSEGANMPSTPAPPAELNTSARTAESTPGIGKYVPRR